MRHGLHVICPETWNSNRFRKSIRIISLLKKTNVHIQNNGSATSKHYLNKEKARGGQHMQHVFTKFCGTKHFDRSCRKCWYSSINRASIENTSSEHDRNTFHSMHRSKPANKRALYFKHKYM